MATASTDILVYLLVASKDINLKIANETTGLLKIVDSNPNLNWHKDELLLVEGIAEQLSISPENARLFLETQISLNRTNALYEVSRSVLAFSDINSSSLPLPMRKRALTFLRV